MMPFDSGEVKLSLVEGKLYVHDGHHRLVSAFMRGYASIPESDCHIESLSLEEYDQINYEKGYVTPFNLIEECRQPEFYRFKKMVMNSYLKGGDVNTLTEIIRNARYMYAEKRIVQSIRELAQRSF
jgi:hypothetical protein